MNDLDILNGMLNELENGSDLVAGNITTSEYVARRTALIKAINALESSSWIPVKTKDLTDEDVVRLVEKSCGLFDADDFEHWKYDCKLPDRNQEVLITTKYGIASTTFCVSLELGCYFEDYEERDDVLAWMPLPKPYTKEGDDNAI